MIWRSIIIIFIHCTIALLIWSGYYSMVHGEGLPSWIAFPAAIILYLWHMRWIQSMCDEHQVCKQDLLEYLEENAQ